MTSRERLLAAIEFTGPDRAPIHHYCFPGALREHGQQLLDLLAQYPDDFGNEAPLANWAQVQREGDTPQETVTWRDGWGTTWIRSTQYTSGEVIEPAIRSWEADWASYEFPPSPAPEHFERFAASVAAQHPERFVMTAGGGLFQHVQNLRGPESFFLDIGEDRAELHELLDRLVDYYLPTLDRHLAAGADCAVWGDDWGAQDAMMCSPTAWRRIFKPRYQRLFDVGHEHGAKIWTHSDGWILEILPDLLEMGVAVINPQHPCMGTPRVGQIVGGKACIRTDIDRQWVIPYGTPAEVRAAVNEAMDCFGRFNGGILFHGEVGPGVPWENIVALYETFYEVGKYGG
ncbi:MAG: hypothetical protein IT204_19515 [Fimbriimonadaceae bacterium]|nr:hypothetical protein [Fimbriimonadaceae bacterium]